jgi:hypothetical protein
MAALDQALVRIAKKLSRLQGVAPAKTVVPRVVATAFRDLEAATGLAEKVLRRQDDAFNQFIAKIGGRRRAAPGLWRKSFAMSPRASVLLAQAQQAPIEGPMCRDEAIGTLTILQAAFLPTLAAVSATGDSRLEPRAMSPIAVTPSPPMRP